MQYKNIQNITLKINEQQNILSNVSNEVKTLEESLEDKANAEHTHTTTDITDINNLKNTLLEIIYPVGSIYTSMTNTSPATLFGFGTWTQITDRFLYCSSSSSKTTGGSKTITKENLPAHTHNGQFRVVGYPVKNGHPPKSTYVNNEETTGLYIKWDKSAEGIQINVPPNTDGGEDYMPPYITVYCWYRVE